MEKKLSLYNSLTNKKEIFKPIIDGKVGIYVCGPTVYSSSHMGHARSAIVFDVIVKFLRNIGYEVTYVKNFTDIDDKIIGKALEFGVDSNEIAEKYKQEYIKDMKDLGCIEPDFQPCVSDNIDGIINLILSIIDKGFAYEANGDVYFNISKFENYGKLSNQSTDSMLANHRVELNPNKKNDLDFALWKKAKDNEPYWDSPWGRGRPGWHIECSVMSCNHLGSNFDIHGGGKDLIFPHHENEIAQSECLNEGNFANYWLHNGLININQEKMSKSIGNIINIRDALEKWDFNLLRIFFLSHHYRTPVDLSEERLIEIEKSIKKIIKKINTNSPSKNNTKKFNSLWKEAMLDDFNSAKAFGVFFKCVNDGEISRDNINEIAEFENVMGINGWLNLFKPKKKSKDDEIIMEIIDKRNLARKEKNWKLADELRDKAESLGFILVDKKDSTTWEPKDQ